MAKVYFSYSLKDKDIVDFLASRIQEAGHEVFIADNNIKPGELLHDNISKKLRTTDALIGVITSHSKSSQWVISEISRAYGYFQERGKPKVIPVVFDNEDIPDFLKGIYGIFASRENIIEVSNRIIEALEIHAGELQAQADEKKENVARVEQTASIYIGKSLVELKRRENHYKKIAYLCYALSFVTLIICVLFSMNKISLVMSTSNTLATQIQIAVLGVFIITLIIAASRYCFVLGKSFMVESLRNADRIHAISFGEFYLKAFQDKVDRNEIKEVFQHWNIDKGSTFISQTTGDFDPEILKNLIELSKVFTKK